MSLWPAYIVLGLFTGFFAGMLGIGGGLVMVPVLTMLFAAQAAFPPGELLRVALGTSAAVIVFTSLSSLRAHHQHQAVLWKVVGRITPGILLGTLLGTLLASRVDARPLAVFFTGFVCFVALQMVLGIKPKASRELPGLVGMIGAGTGIGGISSLVAVGGGSFTVPFLSWCNVPMHKAIGTSAAVGFPIALGSALGYAFNGYGHAELPSFSLGYVYLPALVWIVPPSMLAAPFGARVAHCVPVPTLKRVFAGLLVVLASRMLWKLFH